VPDGRGRVAWLALFLFPSVFLYDATLTIAADHIAALFAIPAYLCLVRALRDLRPAACVLFALQLAGLLLTKYTSLIAAAVPALALALRALWLTWQRARGLRPRGGLPGLSAAFVTGLLVTTPHWLKNWMWYGDPVYPMLYRHLQLRPWNVDSPFLIASYQAVAWQATGTAAEKLEGTLRALYNYSYELYHWLDFHGRYPIVGSLFTFCLFALPWLDRTRRIWLLVIATHVGIARWYLLFHNDRYLQGLLPWMATCVAAVIALCWRAGWLARAGVVALVSLQLVWGLDMLMWPLHKATHESGMGSVAAFFARSYKGDRHGRTRPFEEYAALGRMLPRGAKALVHHEHLRLGLGVMSVTDAPPLQHGINYARLGSSRALHRQLRQLGVTHLVWQPQVVYGDESAGGDLVFHSYVRHLVRAQMRGSRTVAELPAKEPADDASTVFYFGCNNLYQNGLYDTRDLHVSPLEVAGWPKKYPPPRVPLQGSNAPALIARASHAIVNRTCPEAPGMEDFDRIARRESIDYLRRK
jgi:hypothetical protein